MSQPSNRRAPGQPSVPSIPEDPAERLGEVAELLALGFLRLAARENASNPRDFREVPLDFTGQASVHGAARNRRGERP